MAMSTLDLWWWFFTLIAIVGACQMILAVLAIFGVIMDYRQEKQQWRARMKAQYGRHFR